MGCVRNYCVCDVVRHSEMCRESSLVKLCGLAYYPLLSVVVFILQAWHTQSWYYKKVFPDLWF